MSHNDTKAYLILNFLTIESKNSQFEFDARAQFKKFGKGRNSKVVSATENLKKYPKVDKSTKICREKYFPFEFLFLML